MISMQNHGNRDSTEACYTAGVDPTDIWQAAQVLISQHGQKAESVAADHFVQFQKIGDEDNAAIWTAIMIAIRQLTEPPPQ